jgi:hypothetical protein
MIGTLVVTLPSKFSGGAMVVRHHDERLAFRGSGPKLGLVAFYADCHHEVRPVKEGYRVVLTYNLLLNFVIKFNDGGRSSHSIRPPSTRPDRALNPASGRELPLRDGGAAEERSARLRHRTRLGDVPPLRVDRLRREVKCNQPRDSVPADAGMRARLRRASRCERGRAGARRSTRSRRATFGQIPRRLCSGGGAPRLRQSRRQQVHVEQRLSRLATCRCEDHSRLHEPRTNSRRAKFMSTWCQRAPKPLRRPLQHKSKKAPFSQGLFVSCAGRI